MQGSKIFFSYLIVFGLILTGCEQDPKGISRIRVLWNTDPARQATIGWDADTSRPQNQKVYYDTVDHGLDVTSYAYTKGVDAHNGSLGMDNTFARLSDLNPATTYYFLVSDGTKTSERFYFTTASDTPDDRISVIAGGDSRNNRDVRQNANSLVSKLRADFVFFGGDMTNLGTTDEWKAWMNDWALTIHRDGRVTPLIIARGNHELSNNILYDLFDTPENVYYAMSMGGNLLRTYTLNSEISVSGNQAVWLEEDLKAHDSKWKMAQYHRPMRPHTAGKTANNSIYDAWAALFYQYGVRLVMESDSHTVKSTWLLKPDRSGQEDFVREDTSGTVYLGEGCWGAPLRNNDDDKSWTRASGSFNQFKWIFIDGEKIEARTIRVDNANDVGDVSPDDRFTSPTGLEIWNPPSGPVVEIR